MTEHKIGEFAEGTVNGATAVEEERVPSAPRLAAFAGPGVPISALQIPLLAYIPTLYATKVGLALGTIGTVLLLV